MTRMSAPKYAPGYDLFKLIVAVILTIILIALLLRDRPQPPALPADATKSATPLSPTLTRAITATASLAPQASPTAISPTATPIPAPTATPTPLPVATPTKLTSTSGQNTCPSTSSRIQIGDDLRVLVRLNFRSGPGLGSPIILTNSPGATMKVIGGPVCIRLGETQDSRAYLWWNVRKENGQEGWSAEASLISPYYFLAPIH